MYGFLRETQKLAEKAGIDRATGFCRTGLDVYLKTIFPEVNDWIHDKAFGEHNGIKYLVRPDYRSETLKMIVEFNGLPHYQYPDVILNDERKLQIYQNNGYKTIAIPYFIQLDREAVKILFNKDLELFPEGIPSLTIAGRCTPSYLCPLGAKRMREEFFKFPKQREINIKYLESLNNPDLTGVDLLY